MAPSGAPPMPMPTVLPPMSDGKREYPCAFDDCAGIVAVSAVQRGVIEGVCCPVCHRAQTVYLGGYRPGRGGGGAVVVRNVDPRLPPMEDGPVRPWKRR